MNEVVTVHGYVLLKQWQDTPRELRFDLWLQSEKGPVHVMITGQSAVMFVPVDVETSGMRQKDVELRTLEGRPVKALYFDTQKELERARNTLRQGGVRPLEGDIKPVERFLMERFVTGAVQVTGAATFRVGVLHFENPRVSASDYVPELRVLSLDIETDGFDGALLSVAAVSAHRTWSHVVQGGDEKSALFALFAHIHEEDPDIIVGWNIVDFDLDYLSRLCRRLKLPFRLGRSNLVAEVLEPKSSDQPKIARVPGRAVLDGIATLRSATIMLESYALDDVAQALLGKRKDIQKTEDAAEEIRRMAAQDPAALARYNEQDCRLVLEIFEHAKLIDFVVERQRLTGLAMDRQGGSVAAFDQLYLPRLHRAGYVAPSVGDRPTHMTSPGGYVMDSVPGLYKNVIVLDFKSLYPSLIRTFLVDPLGIAQPGVDPIEGFLGARFAREGHILPEIVESLWTARDKAKAQKNEALSRAIKIMMNSFYGVLGTPGCRFFDHRLVSSITLRGHEVILESRRYIEAQGLKVIYGDTDSLFVLLDQNASPQVCEIQGRELALALTAHFRRDLKQRMRLTSHMELEYECLFHRFLMPKMRGSEVGTKKRYAGSVVGRQGNMSVVFKGMEAVRTDWTPLARRVQRELYKRVFSDAPYQDYLVSVVDDLFAGRLDHELVYRKRLRRRLQDYEKNVPPHVQAARKYPTNKRFVEYFITTGGPEPLERRNSPLDYEHYLYRQLAPATQSLLSELGQDLLELTGRQLSLF